ncbi:MAG: hypothetical protein K9J12_04570 [Melioribacteraceae bacterium]|nr:hypothetical protein [Melioribacteraceae bacterium]MCF8263535.1 hypothetical protein [Melioribacteraceae bacterium]MCF8413519.1 hypothetical protein [Melioribacteraceae bacterium]MCF8430661.1 hypothetical protein [Melioribacteraceae bacterium]
MSEDLYLSYKFRNRKTGEISKGFVHIPNVENHAIGLKDKFNIHDFKIIERNFSKKEDYDEWRRMNRKTVGV